MRRLPACCAVVAVVAGLSIGASSAAAKPVSGRLARNAAAHAVTGSSGTAGTWRAPGTSPLSAALISSRPRARALARQSRASNIAPAVLAATSPTVQVTVTGAAATLQAAVLKVGGRVLAAVPEATTAQIPRAGLVAFAATPGVGRVEASVRGYTQGVISEGVHASGADSFVSGTSGAGKGGAGVTIGIVDGGFTNLAAEVAAGNLPAGTTVGGDHCEDVNDTEHGTAVAEIVHQMAPQAALFLECVDDEIGFQQAESELPSGTKIVNSSLGFEADSRGDGTGDATSTAATVRKARKAGILWIQSAGNNGEDHWAGTLYPLTRVSGTDYSSLLTATVGGHRIDYDEVAVPPGTSFGGLAVLKWDQWPTSNLDLLMIAVPEDQQGNEIGDDSDIQTAEQVAGSRPVIEVNLPSIAASDFTYWQIGVFLPNGTPPVRYDLSYWGEVAGDASYLAGYFPAQAAAGSLTEPASSPYALAVGAAYQQDDSLEAYSSQGPSIDGRIKPDLTGYDCVSSNLASFSTGFCGTSAAAPHVAGAAALLSAVDPSLDASQLQAALQSRAGLAPPTNQLGHGLLQLGAPGAALTPSSADYTPLSTPVRVLDTGTTHLVGARQQVTVPIANAGVPAAATAVAINLTGASARAGTYLSAFPGSHFPGTSNLNLASTALDNTAAVFAIVSLAADHTITVYNAAGAVRVIVDVLGYFQPGAGTGLTPLTPTRLYDSRSSAATRLGPSTSVQISAAGPADATAAVVNVTETAAAGSGSMALSPIGSSATSTVNYVRGATRANLTVVGLSGGSFFVTNRGSAVDVVVDLEGFVRPGGAGYVALPSPERIVDTRTGNGLLHAPLGVRQTQFFTASGFLDVPYSAVAVSANLTAITPSTATYLTAFPGATRPSTSNLNVTAKRVVPNAAILGQSNSGFNLYNAAGATPVVVDVSGYFLP